MITDIKINAADRGIDMLPCRPDRLLGTFSFTLPAENASACVDGGGILYNHRMKAAFNTSELFDFRARMDGDQMMFFQPFDVRPQRTEGAVIRRIEFIQFRDLAAQVRAVFHQDNGSTRIGNIEGCAYARNPAADDQYGQ